MLALKPSIKAGGLGLFATQAIPAGTRIFTEAPIIAFTHPPTPFEILTAVEELPLADKQAYLSLTYAHDLDELPTYSLPEGLSDISADRVKQLVAIFENNAFDIPGSSSGVPGAGIFLQGTRIHHSCLPNVSHSWNKQLNAKVFHALRDLEKGEELTISYILPFQAREARQRYLLEKHGYVCQCVACDREAIFGRASEGRSNEIQDLHVQWNGSRGEGGGWMQEKVLCERLLELVEEEGLRARCVGNLHAELSEVKRLLGDHAGAVSELEKAIDITVRCFGRDEELVEELEEDLVALRLGLSAQSDTKGVET